LIWPAVTVTKMYQSHLCASAAQETVTFYELVHPGYFSSWQSLTSSVCFSLCSSSSTPLFLALLGQIHA